MESSQSELHESWELCFTFRETIDDVAASKCVSLFVFPLFFLIFRQISSVLPLKMGIVTPPSFRAVGYIAFKVSQLSR